MAIHDATPVEFRRSPDNGGPFDATPPVAHASVRRRFHGVALVLVGVVAVSAGLLVGELGYATVVGAGVGTYGLYLWMQ